MPFPDYLGFLLLSVYNKMVRVCGFVVMITDTCSLIKS